MMLKDTEKAVDANPGLPVKLRRPEPVEPALSDYAEEELSCPVTPLDSPQDLPVAGRIPEPKHTVSVDVRNGTLAMEHEQGEQFRVPLSLQAIHALYHPAEKDVFKDGIRLRISRRDLATPLGFEALLQIIMMNMVSSVFPRKCLWRPMRNQLDMYSLEVEVNYIRNAAFINELNHSHVLKGCLAGKPLLMVLPGPSLDVEYIREHRDSFVVLAAGRAIKTLFDAGIDPDFVYIQDINSKAWGIYLDGLGDRKTTSTLIANPAGRIWKYHHNFARVFKAWNLYPFERDVFPRIEEIAPSTMSGAYSVARLMECESIVLMGTDCGSNAPCSEASSIPEAFTDLDYDTDGDDLFFSPLKMVEDIYLRFGDEFSINTKKDYIAGAQWLKMKAVADAATSSLRIYDLSQTGICRFNSPILSGEAFVPKGRVSVPTVPSYGTNYDMEKFLKPKASTYGFFLRQLNKGIIPKSAWRYPNTCILTRTTIEQSDNRHTRPVDVNIVRDNVQYLLDHIEIAMEELAERSRA